jgi:protein arginine N-methyltransferase 1
VNCWEKNALGLDLSAARSLVVNEPYKVRFAPQQLLTRPAQWAIMDYATVDNPNACGSVGFSVDRAGTGHGLLLWFETELVNGVGFSNAPDQPEAIYGAMFLPWTEPVALAANQKICVHLDARLIDGDYLWRWSTRVASADTAKTILQFDQSQFVGSVFSPESLRRSASDHVPTLSEDGVVNRRALELMDGEKSLEEIARRLTAEFPRRFLRWQQALSYSAKISREVSR